jgi:hypothetical protein
VIESYKSIIKAYMLYWRLYGGGRALITSPYLHLSIVVTAICSPVWLVKGDGTIWPDAAINILPNIMGFSVAGMAILLALSNPETMKAITEEGRADSYFVETIANFFHFIFVQAIALLLAFIGKHYTARILSGLGTFFLVYSIMVGIAMAMQLLQTARVVNAAASLPENDKGEQ